MIYFENRSLFIHIPRTSGLSVSKAVLRHKDPEGVGVNVILGHGLGEFWRHSQAHRLCRLIPDWENLKRFTIIRNPWRICESQYRHFQGKVKQIPDWFTEEGRERMQELAAMPFSDFVLDHFKYLRQGFYAHWALEWGTLQDLGVETFRFEELNWLKVCELMELPPDTRRPLENAGMPVDVEWTDAAVKFIRKHCSMDFERFDYPKEP